MKAAKIYKTLASREILLQRYDEYLAHWPVPVEKLEVNTSFGRTFVLAWGNSGNPPLVLLHGSMANSAIWADDAAPFASHFRVYAIDLPGEPGHSQPERLELTGPEPARWLSQVLDELGLANTYLLGISMGGFYALSFSAACPERVKKLVLLCPGGVTRQRLSVIWRFIKLQLFGSNRSDGAIRLVYGNAEITQEVIDYTKMISDHFNPVPYLPILPDQALKCITVPTLLLAGDEDIMLDSIKTILRLSKLLPDFHPVLLPGVGHAVINQSSRVIEFLKES